MELVQAFADQEVRHLLTACDKDDLAEAFSQIDAHLRKRFAKGARDRIQGLSPQDLADAWQDALRDLLKTVRIGQYDPDRELAPWIWLIFIRRAFDYARRNQRYERLLEGLRERLVGTEVGDSLKRIDEEERRELLERVRRSVGTLPDRQRSVVRTFVNHFPASEDKEALRQHVSEEAGVPVSRAVVARALQEARRKASDAMRETGQ